MSDSGRKPRIVYSTGVGRLCPECGRAVEACVCKGKPRGSPFDALTGFRPGPASQAGMGRGGQEGGARQDHPLGKSQAAHPADGATSPASHTIGGAPVAKLRLETKGRGGKSVTVIYELAGGTLFLEDLARELKRACGTGGSVGEGTIELQGDRRERLRELLAAKGYRVKG